MEIKKTVKRIENSSGWIVHYADGTTMSEKKFGKVFQELPRPMEIVSAQIHNRITGKYHTVTKPLEDMRILADKVGLAHLNMRTGQQVDEKFVGERIILLMNKNGNCMILTVDQKNGHAITTFDNVFRMGLNFEMFGIEVNIDKENNIKEIVKYG